MTQAFHPVTGHKMAAYVNVGNVATPAWALASDIGDLSITDLARNLAELKRRGNDFTKNLPAMIGSIGIEFRLHFGLNQGLHNLIRSDFFNGYVRQWAFANGPINVTGVQGIVVPCLVEQFPWDQALENASGHDVRLAIGYEEDANGTETDPFWFFVGGGGATSPSTTTFGAISPASSVTTTTTT